MPGNTELGVFGGEQPPPLAKISEREWTLAADLIQRHERDINDQEHGLKKEIDDLKHDRTKRDAIIALVAGALAILLTLVATKAFDRLFQ